ncbi:hypothetical protein E2C01_027474 [Portunus trituberculatus]|uniref:Uncharacterized protein n=1 Tax=Portunus trituberculatus TaxID=210409 RepID=A0A5B7ELM4_PORTR|nr:hypothetical protein [Portunus trituberculatus]
MRKRLKIVRQLREGAGLTHYSGRRVFFFYLGVIWESEAEMIDSDEKAQFGDMATAGVLGVC